MGAWGVASDERDDAYNCVGLGMEHRMGGLSLTKEGRGPNGFVKDVVQMGGSQVLSYPCVAILLLKLGCTVPVANLRAARVDLSNENPHATFPEDGEERKAAIQQEIKLIDEAIENGGVVPGEPIGLRGIFQPK